MLRHRPTASRPCTVNSHATVRELPAGTAAGAVRMCAAWSPLPAAGTAPAGTDRPRTGMPGICPTGAFATNPCIRPERFPTTNPAGRTGCRDDGNPGAGGILPHRNDITNRRSRMQRRCDNPAGTRSGRTADKPTAP